MTEIIESIGLTNFIVYAIVLIASLVSIAFSVIVFVKLITVEKDLYGVYKLVYNTSEGSKRIEHLCDSTTNRVRSMSQEIKNHFKAQEKKRDDRKFQDNNRHQTKDIKNPRGKYEKGGRTNSNISFNRR